ncbi:SDR family oxidoreductase [Salinirubrum litoreum]|uniref:SDR family oxidoreductase n=1 Tax=Salinirubrum litoreum TaxID=1126234 RepID=A0ABD5R8N6_9EURY|nr:SDR family oxidoreductase [Salinirubrum litoreum]
MTGVVCVTGCDSGIGYLTAVAFHRRDWTVYATGLAPEETDLSERGIETRRLDVTDAADTERVFAEIESEHGRLDCLVNVAGVGHTGALEATTPDDLREILDVNLVGTHRVTRAALPLLRAGETAGGNAGRVVTISSVVGRYALPGLGGYSASKHGVEGLSDALRWEVADSGVRVVLVEPPTTRTGFVDRVESDLAELLAGEGDDTATADDRDGTGRYDRLYRMLDWWIPRLADAGASPADVARTVVRATETPDPRTRYPVGAQGWLLALGSHLPGRLQDLGWRGATWIAERRWP